MRIETKKCDDGCKVYLVFLPFYDFTSGAAPGRYAHRSRVRIKDAMYLWVQDNAMDYEQFDDETIMGERYVPIRFVVKPERFQKVDRDLTMMSVMGSAALDSLDIDCGDGYDQNGYPVEPTDEQQSVRLSRSHRDDQFSHDCADQE